MKLNWLSRRREKPAMGAAALERGRQADVASAEKEGKISVKEFLAYLKEKSPTSLIDGNTIKIFTTSARGNKSLEEKYHSGDMNEGGLLAEIKKYTPNISRNDLGKYLESFKKDVLNQQQEKQRPSGP